VCLTWFESTDEFLLATTNNRPWTLEVICELDCVEATVLENLTEELLIELSVDLVSLGFDLCQEESIVYPLHVVNKF